MALFREGYYWEAHEAWEGLWHAHDRRGPIADTLKGLIKLAAAGVKVRQRQPHGIATHASRAAVCFEAARIAGGDRLLGLNLAALAAMARALASGPPPPPGDPNAPVVLVLDLEIQPRPLDCGG